MIRSFSLPPWSGSLYRRFLPSFLTWTVLALTWVLSVGLVSPAYAQYIDENRELREYTHADFVTKQPPDWIGPYNWFWLPQDGYEFVVVESGRWSKPSNIPSWSQYHPSNLDKYTCVIVNDLVGDPQRRGNPFNYQRSMRCNPPIKESTGGDRYMHNRISGYFPHGDSFVETSKGGGYGEVVFTWNWRKHIVHKKLCDSLQTSRLSKSELVWGQQYTDLTQQERVQNKIIKPEDINVDVHVCSDNPSKEEPNRPQPYNTFTQMSWGQKKCNLQVMQAYDTGHAPQGDYARTWTDYVPQGWFFGENPGFDKSQFMQWCIQGGPNPFSPDPFPGLSKGEFDVNKAYQSNIGGDYPDQDVEKIWSKVENLAGTGPTEQWAIRRCSRLYTSIVKRRKAAFFELCKKEPYSFWNGCWKQLRRCRGYKDGKSEIGVNQCCTDTYPEYHYHRKKSFSVPCKPFDAVFWAGNAAGRAGWESHDPDNNCDGIFDENCDGPLGDYDVMGLTGNVEHLEDRGFVGSNKILAPIGGDGEAMHVKTRGTKQIGSYFWFDLMSGTIGLYSFDQAGPRKQIRLPATHKEARGTEFWKPGNTIRGSDNGVFDDENDISGQRGECGTLNLAGCKQKGFLYHLFFCERTFTKEQLKLMRRKWKTPAAQIAEGKDKICAKGKSYAWDPSQEEFRCIDDSKASDEYGDTPPIVEWCARCEGHDPHDPPKYDHGPADQAWCPTDHYTDYQWVSAEDKRQMRKNLSEPGAMYCTHSPKGQPPSDRPWPKTAVRYCATCDNFNPIPRGGKEDDGNNDCPQGECNNDQPNYCPPDKYTDWTQIPLWQSAQPPSNKRRKCTYVHPDYGDKPQRRAWPAEPPENSSKKNK